MRPCSLVRPVVAFGFAGAFLVTDLDGQQRRPAPAVGPLPSRSASVDPAQDRAILGPGTVVAHGKISNEHEGFPDAIDSGARFGSGIASLGDLDGDGVEDAAVGAPGLREVLVLFLGADRTVATYQEIGRDLGGFTGAIDPTDFFGASVAALGDLDGDGICDLAVGDPWDDDGGATTGEERGAVWVLFLNANGTVKAHQKISSTQGGFTGALDRGDVFGSSLTALGDLDGNGVCDLAVGAPGDDDGTTNSELHGIGAVWVLFLETGGTVLAHQKISRTAGSFTGNGLGINDDFGVSLATIGDLAGDGTVELAVGATGDDQGGANVGAVFVLSLDIDGTVATHRKIGAGLSGFTGTLDPAGVFGSSLAALGDLDGDGNADLAVGTSGDDDGGDALSHRGALWILFLNADATVAASQKISAVEGGFTGALDEDDLLGSAAGLLGDLDGDGTAELAVGAAGDDDGGLSPHGNNGAVWVLTLEADGTVGDHQKISSTAGGLPETLDLGDIFGGALTELGDLDGDGTLDLAVGAIGDDDGINGIGNDKGAVWVLFLDEDETVESYRKINGSEGGFTGSLEGNDAFGASLAALGDLDGNSPSALAVGAPGNDDGGGYSNSTGRGAVWVLFLASDGTVQSHVKISDTQGGFTGVLDEEDSFGTAVAALGDLDGDGVGDLAVGAPADDDDGFDKGAVWILFLESDGSVKAHQKISATSGGFSGDLTFSDQFGSSLGALDLDGDGVTELAVGAPFDDDSGPGRGAVWVLSLNADGTVAAHQKISGTQGGFAGSLANNDNFGRSVKGFGDLDRNGVVDLAVGAPSVLFNNRGRVWILLLTADGSVETELAITQDQSGFTGILDEADRFGSSLATLGDLDADGVDDLVVGSPGDDDGGPSHGALWLLSLDGIAALDFETGDDQARTALVNGQDLSSPPEFGRTVELASSGLNLGPAIFDSTPLGPNDPSQDSDLLVGLGNLLILQNNQNAQVSHQTVPGIFDHPNDDQDGGTSVLAFHAPVQPLQLDLVDIDVGPTQSAIVTLVDTAGRFRTYFVPAGWTEDLLSNGPPAYGTLDLTTLDPQAGFLASATASQSAGFDPRRVTRIEVHLGSSGALDNLCWDPHPD